MAAFASRQLKFARSTPAAERNLWLGRSGGTRQISLQRGVQKIGEPRASQRNTLFCKAQRRGPVAVGQRKRSRTDTDRLHIDVGLRRLEAFVDPHTLIGDRRKLGAGFGKLLGGIDRVLRMSAGAEHIVPEGVQLDRAAPAAAMDLDVVSAGVAVRLAVGETRCCV